jgi:ubiquinone/menaquinone biosynthesis C-methylase UbiE
MDSKFWNEVYGSKAESEVSWFEEVPIKSLELISELRLTPDSRIIDVGGGESRLAECLLGRGYKDISILDISCTALEKVKVRLGSRANSVKFIVSDITRFDPIEQYSLWHDRATFHFLTAAQEIEAYLDIANRALRKDGYLIVSTFSKTGPNKCSGLSISNYSDIELKSLFAKSFSSIKCFETTHSTPWGSAQNFLYCGFKKLSVPM